MFEAFPPTGICLHHSESTVSFILKLKSQFIKSNHLQGSSQLDVAKNETSVIDVRLEITYIMTDSNCSFTLDKNDIKVLVTVLYIFVHIFSQCVRSFPSCMGE